MPFLLVGLLLLGAVDLLAQRTKITVYSETARGYRREKLPDGSLKPIRYAISFAKAYNLTSAEHIANAEFGELLSAALVQALEAQGFTLAADSASAEQLLVVHAGTTDLPSWVSPGSGSVRYPTSLPSLNDERTWALNAHILGYSRSYNEARLLDATIIGRTLRQDLTEDMLDPRHYIVIAAYDFAKAKEDDKTPWLWRAHVNVDADGPPFIDRLDTMLGAASRYLGRNSVRIIRDFRTEVEIGPATVVEEDTRE